MAGGIARRITDAGSLEAVFGILRSCPAIGDFLAYQFSVDLNYSTAVNFSEMDFVVPGPGVRDGIRKCESAAGGGFPRPPCSGEHVKLQPVESRTRAGKRGRRNTGSRNGSSRRPPQRTVSGDLSHCWSETPLTPRRSIRDSGCPAPMNPRHCHPTWRSACRPRARRRVPDDRSGARPVRAAGPVRAGRPAPRGCIWPSALEQYPAPRTDHATCGSVRKSAQSVMMCACRSPTEEK